MNESLTALAVVALSSVLGYVLGSIPSGVLVCLPLGKDPRTVASGRTGGTNVLRTAGPIPALLTVLLDVAKGYGAVAVAEWLVERSAEGSLIVAQAAAYAMSAAAVAAIAGHNYPVWTGFQGGAGTSPNVGALLRLDPLSFVASAALAVATLFAVRIASVASLVATAAIALSVGIRIVRGDLPPALLLYALGQAMLVTWALRPNIRRLRQGTERRIGAPPSESAPAGSRF